MAEYEKITQEFEPVYNEDSEILILGSLPSVKSREQGFYYGHPRNRFWKVLSGLLAWKEPETIAEKKEMLLQNHIALWDVIASCEIKGSSDSSIRNVVPADIPALLKETGMKKVYANGQTAGRLYKKFIQERTEIEADVLPSISPANAAYSLERLLDEWGKGIHIPRRGRGDGL